MPDTNSRHAFGSRLRRRRQQLAWPREFLLYLTNACNLRCSMCTQSSEAVVGPTRERLPLDAWTRFIDEVAVYRPRLVLFGGEPLLYPQFRELVRAGHQRGCKLSLVTNGYHLLDHADCIQRHQVQTTVSMDGTRAIHNTIRGSKDSFERIVSFLEWRRNLDPDHAPRLSINLVMLPDNVDHILDFISLVQEYRPNAITLQHPQFSYPALHELNDEVWLRTIGTVDRTRFATRKNYDFMRSYTDRLDVVMTEVKERPDYANIFFFPDLDSAEVALYYQKDECECLRPELLCLKPWERPTITASGDVVVCLGHSVGNILQSSFEEIWTGEAASRFRSKLEMLGRFPLCSRCCDLYNAFDLEPTTGPQGSDRSDGLSLSDFIGGLDSPR